MINFSVWAIFAGLLAPAHELPDGVIDRSLQIDVRPDEISISMSVGLNDTTIADELARIGVDDPAADVAGRLDQLRDWATEHVASYLRILLDDQAVHFTEVTSELSSRHHVRFFIKLSAPIPAGKASRTIQVDDVFMPHLQTQLRMAARGRGVAVLRSNVAPLVVRAERWELWTMNDEEAAEKRIVRLSVAFPD